jgi:hypothetical protein
MVERVKLYRWAGGSNRSSDSQLKDQLMEREEGGNQEDTPKARHDGGGIMYDGQ